MPVPFQKWYPGLPGMVQARRIGRPPVAAWGGSAGKATSGGIPVGVCRSPPSGQSPPAGR